MATATREDALHWCVNMGADFKEPIDNPPGGWMWAEDDKLGLILVPVFSLGDIGKDITMEDIVKFKETKPAFLTQDEASHWVSKYGGSIISDSIIPPSGWYYVKDSNGKYFLQPVPANDHGTSPIEIPVIHAGCSDH